MASVLAAAWTAWFLLARVAVFETSVTARIEVDREVHPIAAYAPGRVIAVNLRLGQHVDAGEVLVELDRDADQRRLEEEQQRLAGLTPELDAVRREMVSQGRIVADQRNATRAAVQSARSRLREAEAAARLAALEADRWEALRDAGVFSEVDILRKRTDEEKQRAIVAALEEEVRRVEADQTTRDSQGDARMDQLQRDAARLEGLRATTHAEILVLEQALERRTIRAPASGQLAELAPLQVGTVVREGDRLGTVLPRGDLRLVAEYRPGVALGRIRPGQPALVRLDGFPWQEFGTPVARVSAVAQEPRDGLVRVELDLVPQTTQRISLEHGLTASVDVEVEKVSPATLFFRSLGGAAARSTHQEPRERLPLSASRP